MAKSVIVVRSSNCSRKNNDTTLSRVLTSPDLEVKYVTNRSGKYESGIVRPEKKDRGKINI